MKILLDEKQIGIGIDRLATELEEHYQGNPITIVAIMTGSIVMLADLIRRLEMPVCISLIQASSYRGGMKSGDLTIQDNMMLDIAGLDDFKQVDLFRDRLGLDAGHAEEGKS